MAQQDRLSNEYNEPQASDAESSKIDSCQEQKQKPSASEGFDKLWDITLDETLDFTHKKAKQNKVSEDEVKLLKEELKAKDFEIQKFKWQLSEREKELKKLYEEADEMLQLNHKLNDQLEFYQSLEEENAELKDLTRFVATKLEKAELRNEALNSELDKQKANKGFLAQLIS